MKQPGAAIRNTMNKQNVVGFILKKKYPGCNKPLGYFEPFTTGEFLKFPEYWEPIYKGERGKFFTNVDDFKKTWWPQYSRRAFVVPIGKNKTGLVMFITVQPADVLHFIEIYNLPGCILDVTSNYNLVYISF